VLELGAGAAAALAAGGRGSVVAVFRKAAYLRLPAGLFALTTTDAPAGPLHARGDVPFGRLAAGDPVAVDGPALRAGRVVVDLAGATLWRGELPAPAALVVGAGVALESLAQVPPTALADPSYRRRLDAATVALDGGDLAAAVEALGGLGPGLTPAGDDALAGVLLVARAMGGEPAEPGLVDLAATARTNDVAAAFLAWAARGQSIEPVHRFLAAVAGQDRARGSAALRSLCRFGHSSGADLAFGLGLGIRCLLAPTG
jgi:hypothetical protein